MLRRWCAKEVPVLPVILQMVIHRTRRATHRPVAADRLRQPDEAALHGKEVVGFIVFLAVVFVFAMIALYA